MRWRDFKARTNRWRKKMRIQRDGMGWGWEFRVFLYFLFFIYIYTRPCVPYGHFPATYNPSLVSFGKAINNPFPPCFEFMNCHPLWPCNFNFLSWYGFFPFFFFHMINLNVEKKIKKNKAYLLIHEIKIKKYMLLI